ncbi:MAG: twin-arginine translocase subunit TatC [Chloroflexi bacterium]|nr:twin-arginine translocase subunit TatC [Chloroflexota bacterium]
MTEAITAIAAEPKALFEHIYALRKNILRALAGLAIAVGVSFIFTQRIVNFLARPIGGLEKLQAIEVTETVGVFMRVALLCGFTLAIPYIAFELWLFAAPALRPRAKVIGLFAIPLVLLFFAGGMIFAYVELLPPALKFLINFMGITMVPRPASYISFVIGVLSWIGVAFEFPLVIYVLTAMGLVKPHSLVKHWRIAIVIIAIIGAAITPTTDPVNMMLVMGPMVMLYFIGVGLSYLAAIGQRDRKKEARI